MFAKLHLLSQDSPEGGGGLRWRAHPYLRMAGTVAKGPAVFEWSARQRADLEALWRDAAADGARGRLAHDLAAFCDKLGWAPDAALLEDAERRGDEYLVTISAVPPELYVLPWEVIEVGAAATYLSDYASAQVRYAVPGLEPREMLGAPAVPGVLFAWSAAGGAVPHDEQAVTIRAAAEAGGVAFRELAGVDEAGLAAALDAGPPSVLHLLCHGLPGEPGEPPKLTWGAADDPSEISATQLARMLRRHHAAIRLVVLAACSSGDGHGDPLVLTSLAQELHRKGIPNVVASRYPLSVPGARVMTRALYDKLLREAWSLERALRHTREALLRVDDAGASHPGDAYGIQLYAHDTERFVSDNDVVAERPVLASYPFGTAARPVPNHGPPASELTLAIEGAVTDAAALTAQLRRVAEDDALAIVAPAGPRVRALVVRTTVDGAQRLLGAWRSKVLQAAVGVILGELIVTKGILPAMAATPAASAAPTAGQPAASGNAAGGQAAASQAATATASATTANVAVAGGLLTAKLAVAAVIAGAVVIGGGVAVYRARTATPSAVVASQDPASAAASKVADSAVAPAPAVPAPAISTPGPAAATPMAASHVLPSAPAVHPAIAPPAPAPGVHPAIAPPAPAITPAPPPAPAPSVANPPATEPGATPAVTTPAPRPRPPMPAPDLSPIEMAAPTMPPISSIEPGTSNMKLSFTVKPGAPPAPIRTRSYVTPGTAKAVVFLVPQQAGANGPQGVMTVGAHRDSRLTISARRAGADQPQSLSLRGFRATGCSHVPINDATLCNDGKDDSFLQLGVFAQDNVGVPDGVYSGRITIHAQAQDPPVRTLDALTIDFAITFDHGAASAGGDPLSLPAVQSQPPSNPPPTSQRSAPTPPSKPVLAPPSPAPPKPVPQNPAPSSDPVPPKPAPQNPAPSSDPAPPKPVLQKPPSSDPVPPKPAPQKPAPSRPMPQHPVPGAPASDGALPEASRPHDGSWRHDAPQPDRGSSNL